MRLPSLLAVLPALLLTALPGAARAADHAEAPGAQADPGADIADLYAWHTSDSTIVAVLTYAGFNSNDATAVYDADLLYGVHVDSDGDNEADLDIWVRFGQHPDTGDWGVQVTNLPGASGTVEGAVETVLTDGETQVYAGLRDDPFFFDATGFNDTLSSGDLAFTAVDAVAGFNVSAIVLEFSTAATTGDSHDIQLWSTTARK